jgi:isopenicillin N synthase-like dioxygenase
LTILNTDNTKGALQVLSKSGNWITADPVPGAFVINIGDMVNNWTNDLYKATLHRVIHKGENYRISIPFFFEPNYDAVVEPIPSLLNGEAPKYPSVIYGDHLFGKVSNNFDKESKA